LRKKSEKGQGHLPHAVKSSIILIFFGQKSTASTGPTLMAVILGLPKGSLQDATFTMMKKAGSTFR
jgi:hypothetical protein